MGPSVCARAQVLELLFSDDKCVSLPSELLRVSSPSADTDKRDSRGHSRVRASLNAVWCFLVWAGFEPVMGMTCCAGGVRAEACGHSGGGASGVLCTQVR